MSGSYRVPNPRPTTWSDAPYRIVTHRIKNRDFVQRSIEHLTLRQVSEIRRYLHNTRLLDGTHLMSDVWRMADKYGVSIRTIRIVWGRRPGGPLDPRNAE